MNFIHSHDDAAAVFLAHYLSLRHNLQDGQDGDDHPYNYKGNACPEEDGNSCGPPGGRSLHGRCQVQGHGLLGLDEGTFHGLHQFHRFVDGDDAKRQQESQHGGTHQHNPVEPVEGLLPEHKPVEHIEDGQGHGHFYLIYKECRHLISLFLPIQ